MKFTVEYTTEEGKVTAEFDEKSEMLTFMDYLRETADEKRKAAEEKRKQEEKEIEEKVSARWDEVTELMKTAVGKSKEYGITPEGVVAIFKWAVFSMSDDRCSE